jgi:hypothetical protein
LFSIATINKVDCFYNKDSTENEITLYFSYDREFKSGKIKSWIGSASFYNSSNLIQLDTFIGQSFKIIYDKNNSRRRVLLLNEKINLDKDLIPNEKHGVRQRALTKDDIFMESTRLE